MSNDVFTLFSTAHISRKEYMSWLHQLNAVMIPEEGGPYDARLSKDVHHVWIFLQDEKWFGLTMTEFKDKPEILTNIRQLLGGEPQSAIELAANAVRGSKILAVQFAALCAERYPCVVEQAAGHALFPAHEVLSLRDAGMGFDGFTWETADPDRPFSLEEFLGREELEDALQNQVFARPDMPEGREKRQLGTLGGP
jgi:hypothetical protein